MNNYVSPDYPNVNNMTPFKNWTYQDQNPNQQSFFYGGMGYNSYPAANDPNSRINQTTFNWGQSQNPYAQPAYQQPVQPVQPAVQPVQPFSVYGGSGQQPAPTMPTLNAPAIDFNRQSQPTFNQPVQQQPTPMMPSYIPFAPYDPNAPLFNASIATFDKRTECWDNRFVQPQQVPAPQINWNTVPQQNTMVNPMYQFQNCPAFNQSNQPFQTNWLEIYRTNQAVSYQ